MDALAPHDVEVGPLRVAGEPVTLIGAPVRIATSGGNRSEHVCFIATRALPEGTEPEDHDAVREEIARRIAVAYAASPAPQVIYL